MRTVAFAGYGCPLQADIPVFGMMQKLQEEYPARRDELLDLLGVDLKWRMHQVSDGQRRRVQVESCEIIVDLHVSAILPLCFTTRFS
jgi:CCR4-NOT complex subunit CAF16